MEEFKKFLLDGNPYAINIVLNIINGEMSLTDPNSDYFKYLKDLAHKFIKINSKNERRI